MYYDIREDSCLRHVGGSLANPVFFPGVVMMPNPQQLLLQVLYLKQGLYVFGQYIEEPRKGRKKQKHTQQYHTIQVHEN